MRVFMTDGYSREVEGGTQSFRAGEFYKPQDPEELIEAGVAFDEENPPECPHCGKQFTAEEAGTDAFDLKRAHIEAEHYAEYLKTIDTREVLRAELKTRGIALDDVEATGSDGRVLMDDMRRALVEHEEG